MLARAAKIVTKLSGSRQYGTGSSVWSAQLGSNPYAIVETAYATNVSAQQALHELMLVRRVAIAVVSSIVLIVLSLAFAGSDLGAVLCFGIAIVSALALLVFAVVMKGRQLFAALFVLTAYVFAAMLLMSHYSLVRDHVRWFLVSGGYKAKVLAQPPSVELKHVEWDGWGFAGVGDTTVFLVFDPTDALAGASAARPPIKAQGLPCEVFRVRRLDRQWYAVLFYTDTYWGQGVCK
jgi:hypothetical protein